MAARDYNPFEPYVPRLFRPSIDDYVSREEKKSGDFWAVPNLYQPTIDVRVNRIKRRAVAKSPPSGRTGKKESGVILYDKDDLASWRGTTTKNEVVSNLQGRIGDRSLYLMLESFLSELQFQAIKDGYTESRGEVLEEQRRVGRPFKRHVVQWKGEYLLRFDRRTTFHLFVEGEEGEPLLYVRERRCYQKCEIDGLAPFYVQKKDHEPDKYLVIGEIKTAMRHVDSGFFRGSETTTEQGVFTPFKSLYPGHQLVYLLAGTHRALFSRSQSSGQQRLKPRMEEFVEMVLDNGVMPILIAIPPTLRCSELAEGFYRHLIEYRAEQLFTNRLMNRIRSVHDFSLVGNTEIIFKRLVSQLPRYRR